MPATLGSPDEVVWVRIRDLRWCQDTCGGARKTRRISKGFEDASGKWVPEKGTIDVVRTPDGLVTLDHTRLRVAERYGIERVTARVHNADDLLPTSPPCPKDMPLDRLEHFRDVATRLGEPAPRTWGDLVRVRASSNGLGPTGTATQPTLLGAK